MYHRKIILSLCSMKTFHTHAGNVWQFRMFLWHMIKKTYIHLHLKKIFRTYAENFRTNDGSFEKSQNFLTQAQNLRTHAGNIKQFGNLLCHDRKQIYCFCMIKVSKDMLEVSGHSSNTWIFSNLDIFKHTP